MNFRNSERSDTRRKPKYPRLDLLQRRRIAEDELRQAELEGEIEDELA